jgi:membrane associated rhomboid family serine protease
MNTFWQDIYYKTFKLGSKLNLLIGINVAVFLVMGFINVLQFLTGNTSGFGSFNLSNYLALPAYLPQLLKHFWTPFTYMFVHAGIFHILFNMLWLYWMGQIFEEFLGKKRTLGLYLLGGLAGGALYIISYNIFPVFSQTAELYIPMVGASASVMAIAAAAATIVPNYTIFLRFIGPVRLKWIVLVLVVIDFLSIGGGNAGGEIAHLGGALFGFLYVKQIQKGNDWIAAISALFMPKPKLKVVSNNSNKGKSAGDMPRQEEIDKILDKISKTGYENLSTHEKEILFRASKK